MSSTALGFGGLARRLVALRSRRRLALEGRSASSRLAWQAPATTITVAGLHGGAGASTLTLLLAEAITTIGDAPTVCVDLAGPSRGGLAVHAGAAGQASTEATAALAAVHGIGLDEPLGVTESGVNVIGAYPEASEETARAHETLAARLAEAVGEESDDTRLAALTRQAVREWDAWQALRHDNRDAADAIGLLIDSCIGHHGLVAIDMGMCPDGPLGEVAARRSDLHVWVLPAREDSLEVAERRLPRSGFEPAGREAIAVWPLGEGPPSARRLGTLGDLRGCPVVRLADRGSAGEPAQSLHRCLSGIEELCELAR